MRITFIAGTRPEIIKLGPVHKALQTDVRFSNAALSFVVTGQHGRLATQAANDIDIRPDIYLNFKPQGPVLHDLFTELNNLLADHFNRSPADLVIVQGDTLSALAGAQAAFFRKIPVAHVEAGLRSGYIDNPYPEEMCRRAISLMSAVHFAPTRQAANILLEENTPKARIVVTGNTIIDALESVKSKGRSALKNDNNGRKRVTVTCHRRENWGDGLNVLLDVILSLLQERGDIDVVFPHHPNPQLVAQIKHPARQHARLHVTPPLPYPDFIQTLAHSDLVITDSGGVQEETSYLGIPTIVMRDNTERTEGLRNGQIELCPPERDGLFRSAMRLLKRPSSHNTAPNPFGDGFASARIATALYNWRQHETELLAPHLQFQPHLEAGVIR